MERAARFPQSGMPPSSIHHRIPLSLFLSSCGLPPCQKPFYLLFFPASCKISSFFRFIGFISCGNYLDKKKRFYVHWGILLEGCILEMKKFMNCLKMKKGSLNIPPFPSLSFFNFSIYYHAKPHTITETPDFCVKVYFCLIVRFFPRSPHYQRHPKTQK